MPLGPTAESAETGEVGARRHFNQALELYRAGRYSLALEQLERAAALDPNGKDLFFNLALVHEKLGQLPEAVSALERFRQLETEPFERERARLSIERLRGAEAATRARAGAQPCPEPLPAPPPAAGPNLTLISAASLSVAALAVGAVFGGKALADDVSDEQTGGSVSASQLRERARRAEREALVADVAFAVAAAAAGTFVGVWLLSPSEPTARAAGISLRSYF